MVDFDLVYSEDAGVQALRRTLIEALDIRIRVWNKFKVQVLSIFEYNAALDEWNMFL